MKFKINRSKLSNVLSVVAGAAADNSPTEILKNVLMVSHSDKITLTATNLSEWISVDCEAEIIDGGSVAVNAKFISELVKSMNDHEFIVLEEKNNKVMVRSENGKSKYNVPNYATDDFPKYNESDIDESKMISINGNDFYSFVNSVKFAASDEQFRLILNSIFIRNCGSYIDCVSTDGHRLGYNKLVGDFGANDGINGIVHINTVPNIGRICSGVSTDVKILWNEKYLLIRTDGGRELYARLIEGVYPNFEHVVPKNQAISIITNTNKMFEIVKRVGLAASEVNHQVTISIKDGVAILSSSNNRAGSDGSEELPIDFNGEDIEFSFNGKYLVELLRNVKTEKVRITTDKDAGSATMFYPVAVNDEKSDDWKGLLMPLRI